MKRAVLTRGVLYIILGGYLANTTNNKTSLTRQEVFRMTENRIFSADDVRALCIRKSWYTAGNILRRKKVMYKFEATYTYVDKNGEMQEEMIEIGIDLPLDDDNMAFVKAMEVALSKNGLVKLEIISC